ncbi:MAG: NUDIX hydrolase [Chloroflexi bacterium]|nr:NUDIX hydrolase [Chloroflexota bacterium]
MARRTLSTRYVYRGHVFNVRVDEAEGPTGRRTPRDVVEHPGAVVLVPVNAQGNVILVRQHRHAAGETLLELPAGTREPAEPPEETARRELQEETGYEAAELTPLGGFYSAPGFCTEYLHLFLARGLHQVGATPDADEEITIVPVPLSQIPDLIRRGEIRDAKSIAGLLRAIFLERVR